LPAVIAGKINNEQYVNYLSKFKELARLGYDLWGDNVVNETPSILKF
jgi:hypothetical protein